MGSHPMRVRIGACWRQNLAELRPLSVQGRLRGPESQIENLDRKTILGLPLVRWKHVPQKVRLGPGQTPEFAQSPYQDHPY